MASRRDCPPLGIAELPAGAIPSASASVTIVPAVPIVLQWPGLRSSEISMLSNVGVGSELAAA